MFTDYFEHVKAVAWNAVWATNLATLSPLRAGVLGYVRIGHMLLRELGEGQLTVRAASLVYTTLLSLVPVLAVTFSMLKAFGVHQDFEPTLLRLLEPLGDGGLELGHQLTVFIENLDVGALGALGLAVLMFTVVSLVHKVEQAFNRSWRITRLGSPLDRFARYLTVMMVGPVLVFTALGIIASVTGNALFKEAASIAPVGATIEFASKLLPFALLVAAFTFAYCYIPNRRVNLRSALFGGVFAGLLWAVAGWLFAEMVVTSARYAAIYRSFAILILSMMWLYVGWLVLLVGASAAFYHQHPEYLGVLRHELRLSNRARERISLTACLFVAHAFLHGRPPWTSAALSARLRIPLGPLEDLLRVLAEDGILIETATEPARYMPARDLATIRVAEVLDVVRGSDEGRNSATRWLERAPSVEAAMDAIEDAIEGAAAGRTLRELAAAADLRPEGASVTALKLPAQ